MLPTLPGLIKVTDGISWTQAAIVASLAMTRQKTHKRLHDGTRINS